MPRFRKIKDWKDFIVTYEGVLPRELCNEIANETRKLMALNNRIQHGLYTDINPASESQYFRQLESMCKTLFDPYYEEYRQSLNLHYGDLLYDSISITYYNPGTFKRMHIDLDFLSDEGDTGYSGPVAASCPVTPAANYNGGQIYFLNQNISVKPDAGDLLLFPSSFAYPHEVTDIEGERICVFPYYKHVAFPHSTKEDTLDDVRIDENK
jgi:hypothetical protein